MAEGTRAPRQAKPMLYSDDRHVEVTNLSPDGRFFIVNGAGRLPVCLPAVTGTSRTFQRDITPQRGG